MLKLLLKIFKYLFFALLKLSVFCKIHDQFDSTYLQSPFFKLDILENVLDPK